MAVRVVFMDGTEQTYEHRHGAAVAEAQDNGHDRRSVACGTLWFVTDDDWLIVQETWKYQRMVWPDGYPERQEWRDEPVDSDLTEIARIRPGTWARVERVPDVPRVQPGAQRPAMKKAPAKKAPYRPPLE